MSGFHIEVDFSGFPFFAGFAEECGDQAEEGGFVGENAYDAGAAFEFLVDALERIVVADDEGDATETALEKT